MNKQTYCSERGQALIMIAIGALVLFAFVALTIDGSAVFSDRRHSQNASDTAVLAAALAKVEKESKSINVDWQQEGMDRAADNGYSNNPETVVEVELCSTPITIDGNTFECQGLPQNITSDEKKEYIHIVIKSTVHLKFAPILGWNTIINYTNAVSRATTPEVTNMYDGYGIASIHEGCWSGSDNPFVISGNSTSIVTDEGSGSGAGVLVNAVCPGMASVDVNGGPQLTTDTGLCAPGTPALAPGDQDNVTPGLQSNCSAVDSDQYQILGTPECGNNGTITETPKGSGVWTTTPGNFNTEFPPASGGAGTIIKITKGVYCLQKGINVGSGWTMTTDTNGNKVHDPAIEGVLFYVSGGSITFEGKGYVFVHAISANPPANFSPYWFNLLIYVPKSNNCDPHGIKITGGSGSSFTGTIYAPSCQTELAGTTDGTGGTITLDSQIISDTVKITGGAYLKIIYNESDNLQIPTNPGIALIK